MRFRTDDPIYQQKLFYRGPTGMTMPGDITYPQLFFGVVVVGGLDIFTAVAVSPWAIGVSTVIGVWIVFAVSRKVTPDRPFRKVLRTGVTDWRRRPVEAGADEETVTFSTRHLSKEASP